MSNVILIISRFRLSKVAEKMIAPIVTHVSGVIIVHLKGRGARSAS